MLSIQPIKPASLLFGTTHAEAEEKKKQAGSDLKLVELTADRFTPQKSVEEVREYYQNGISASYGKLANLHRQLGSLYVQTVEKEGANYKEFSPEAKAKLTETAKAYLATKADVKNAEKKRLEQEPDFKKQEVFWSTKRPDDYVKEGKAPFSRISNPTISDVLKGISKTIDYYA